MDIIINYMRHDILTHHHTSLILTTTICIRLCQHYHPPLASTIDPTSPRLPLPTPSRFALIFVQHGLRKCLRKCLQDWAGWEGGKRPAITDKRLILKSRQKGRRRGEGSGHS